MEINIFSFAVSGIMVSLTLALFRAVKGPTLYDRILSVNMMGTKVTILIVLSGYLFNRPDFLDIALLYAIMNIIGTVAFLKIIERKSLAR